ncbi:MAG: DUF72 domain-containing protein [candidate division Zixibacteria bacterium]|nr:DUF72 domain-containing protein [candidate division Zixibacteria bacterium]
MSSQTGHVHIGTSGWSYAHWAKGVFYPRGLKQGEWLPFLARTFDTVEVNSTFYRIPKPSIVERWRDITPSRFKFAVKLWRMITHQKKLDDCESQLRDFLDIYKLFESKRGPLLVQLPPTLQADFGKLNAFIDAIKDLSGKVRPKIVIEPRHESWFTDNLHQLLDRQRASLCVADMPKYSVEQPNDASFVYIRRHGPGGGYRGKYSETHIKNDAAHIRAWLKDGRDVYIYYNNDMQGYAVTNAKQLLDALA